MAKRASAAAIYLGDAVYACIDGDDLILSTGSHWPLAADMVIVLEPDVLAALIRYLTSNGMIGEVPDASE